MAEPIPGIGEVQLFSDGAPRVLVAGATGFAGALAAQLLWRHQGFELAGVSGRSEVGRRLDELYPRYRVPLRIEELDLDRAAGPGGGDRRLPARRGGADGGVSCARAACAWSI